MKAITIHQPYASLIAVGAKRFETLSWYTHYRGAIAIHAAALSPYSIIKMIDDETIKVMLKTLRESEQIPRQGDFRYLPSGAVIATAELVGCWRITGNDGDCACILHTPREGQTAVRGDELLFGDWTPGRYAWELTNVKRLPCPVPCRGRRGLWNWEEGGERA